MTKQWIPAIASVQSRDLAVSALPHEHRQADVLLACPVSGGPAEKNCLCVGLGIEGDLHFLDAVNKIVPDVFNRLGKFRIF